MRITLQDLLKVRQAMVEEAKKWNVIPHPPYFAAVRTGRLAVSHYDKRTDVEAREFIRLQMLAEGLRRIGVHLEEPL